MKIDGLEWMDWLHKMRAERAKLDPLSSIKVKDRKAGHVKHRPLLYLETSIFGFYYDEEPRNALRREAVRALFEQVERGVLSAAVSPLTSEELTAMAEPARTKLLALLKGIAALQPDETEVKRMGAAYVRAGVVSQAEALGALHTAYATVARADIVVSLNLKQLANVWAERRVNAVNLWEGYPLLNIRTPETVLDYED
ncbi:MAG: hypothetical protein NTX53_20645 [candidate division WOR-3 bacterium]|nr:hypothetical protein [candidate division WOR-3 bacterium]